MLQMSVPLSQRDPTDWESVWTYMPFLVTSVCILLLSFALWVKETHTWMLSRCILVVLIWAYCSFTRHYKSCDVYERTIHSINHDHAKAVITWAAWLVYSSILELTPETVPDVFSIFMSLLSVGCVLMSIHVESDRHSKKDGLRRTDWVMLQSARGLFLGMLFIPHRSTLFSLGAIYTAAVSVLFFINFAITSMSTDIDQHASLYTDCKLMQSVWVLVGDIRVTAVVLPYVMYKLNKIRWLTTGEGWDARDTQDARDARKEHAPDSNSLATELECVHVVETPCSVVDDMRLQPAPQNKDNSEAVVKLKKALESKQRQLVPLPPDTNTHALFTRSTNADSKLDRAKLISHLQQVSKQKN